MPYDPCGMVMDLARTATIRDCKFFHDSDVTVKVKWYVAPDNAKFFPEPHKVNHLAWYTEPWKSKGVGEVYASKEVWSNGLTPPNVTGQDFFGPVEYFRHGAPFDPSIHVDRDFWGLAVACTQGVNSGVGGLAIGSDAFSSGCRCSVDASVLTARFTFVGDPCPQLDGLIVPMGVPGFSCPWNEFPFLLQMACSSVQNTGGVPWRLALYCVRNSNVPPSLFIMSADGTSMMGGAAVGIPHVFTCQPFVLGTLTLGNIGGISPCLFGHADIEVSQ